MTSIPRKDKRTLLITDLEMLRVRTFEFGPGRNMNVKYSFFFIFLVFRAFIIPPQKMQILLHRGYQKRFLLSRVLFDFFEKPGLLLTIYCGCFRDRIYIE